jgi:hypothetical protein
MLCKRLACPPKRRSDWLSDSAYLGRDNADPVARHCGTAGVRRNRRLFVTLIQVQARLVRAEDCAFRSGSHRGSPMLMIPPVTRALPCHAEFTAYVVLGVPHFHFLSNRREHENRPGGPIRTGIWLSETPMRSHRRHRSEYRGFGLALGVMTHIEPLQ